MILASDDLEASQAAVEAAGGAISVSAFDNANYKKKKKPKAEKK